MQLSSGWSVTVLNCFVYLLRRYFAYSYGSVSSQLSHLTSNEFSVSSLWTKVGFVELTPDGTRPGPLACVLRQRFQFLADRRAVLGIGAVEMYLRYAAFAAFMSFSFSAALPIEDRVIE